LFSSNTMIASICFASLLVGTSANLFSPQNFKLVGKYTNGARAFSTAEDAGLTGWYSVVTYVDSGKCDGTSITEIMEFGNCVEDMNEMYSMVSISGPNDGLYSFNRTFYEDMDCTTQAGPQTLWALPSECTSGNYTDDMAEYREGVYVSEILTKLTIPRKTMGQISWNTEAACADDKLDNVNYMLLMNHKECYPNDSPSNITFESDDFYRDSNNETAYKSFLMKTCNKVEYYADENCEGEMRTEKGSFGDEASCESDDGEETDAMMYSTYYCRDEKSKRRNVCFAGSETVLLESGATKMMSEVAIGDRVQVYSAETGSTEFSDVIAVPHASNDVLATFVEINTASGSVKMTPDHLVAAGSCSAANTMLPLVRSEDVKVGDCVNTVEGQSMVSSINTVDEKGIYTIVTRGEFLVVGNIVASPFAVNHNILHFFYNLHRALPTGSPLVAAFHAVADQITKIAVLPVIRSVFAVSA